MISARQTPGRAKGVSRVVSPAGVTASATPRRRPRCTPQTTSGCLRASSMKGHARSSIRLPDGLVSAVGAKPSSVKRATERVVAVPSGSPSGGGSAAAAASSHFRPASSARPSVSASARRSARIPTSSR
ncbi:hypothetical protein D7147_27605 [Micromonospora musae]|uniref:Uncharacterized protein n=1 Tax=Micromonospora musae TaxID=1894970 RepID=A0ABX9QXR9_9ACTN|nr:hypothetical protein D7147_27605 [Micromonospora musae]